MKKEGRLDLKTIIPILILLCVLIWAVFAAVVTVGSPVMTGNITVAKGNTIYQNTIINFTIAIADNNGDYNTTNVTIKFDPTYLSYVNGSNATNATSTTFRNTTVGGYIILWWNITENTLGNGSIVIEFNVTPASNVETLNESIIVEVLNSSGGNELVANVSFDIKVDNKNPVVSLITANLTNSSTATNVLLNFSMVDINNQSCILYVTNVTAGMSGPAWGPKDNGSAGSLNNTGFSYDFGGGDGRYVWNVWCNDTLAHSAFNASNYTMVIDTTAPTFNSNVTSLKTSQARAGETVYISANFSDATSGIMNSSLWVTWANHANALNSTNYSGLRQSNEMINFSFGFDTSQMGQTLNFTINVTDFAGNSNLSEVMQIIVNATGESIPPNVRLVDPVNNTNTSSYNLTVTFNVTDNVASNIWCNVTVNGAVNISANTTSAVTAGTYTTLTAELNLTGLSDGVHAVNWTAICWDQYNNINLTVTNRTIALDTVGPRLNGIFNITNATDGGNGGNYSSNLVNLESNATGGVRQGATVTAWFNFTDATTGTRTAFLQVYNNTQGKWMNITPVMNITDTILYTINYTFCTSAGCYQSGANVSMRIVAKDLMGFEANTSTLTVQVNDTAAPIIPSVTIDGGGNHTNISSTTFSLNWTVTENTDIEWLAFRVDGLSNQNYFYNYTSTLVTSQAQRNSLKNGSVLNPVDFIDTAALPKGATKLSNGTHGVEVIVMDSWGNVRLEAYNFTVDTASPAFDLSFDAKPKLGKVARYPANVSLYVWANVTITASTSGIRTIQYYTSCNTTLTTITNNGTAFQPFNASFSACNGFEQFVNITVVATSGSGTTNTTVFEVGLDSVAPVITLNSIDNYTSFAGREFASANISLNFSTPGEFTYLSSVGYYLDGNPYVELDSGNVLQTAAISNFSINVSNGGTHTIILQANDSVGNFANTTQYTFSVLGPINIAAKQLALNASLQGAVARVAIRNASGGSTIQTMTLNSSNPVTIAIDLELNVSQSTALNMTIDGINESAVNWEYINFSVTSDVTLIKENINTNFSTTVLRMVMFNDSIDEFLPNENSYFGRVLVPYNATINEIVVMWFENESDYTARTTVSACSALSGTKYGYTTAYLPTTTTPCYNVSTGPVTTVFVPHFSTVVLANDTNASIISIIAPTINEDTSAFKVNLTVAGDVSSCAFKINASGYYNGDPKDFSSWTDMGTPTGTSPKECLSPYVVGLLNATTGVYNLTLNVTDEVGNQNITSFIFNVTDSDTPSWAGVINSSIDSTGATISVNSSEYVNASVTYGSGTVVVQGDALFTTMTPTISLTGLGASTLINYTVKVCDYAGNCNTSDMYNFTTDSASSTTTTTTTASTGTSGGGVTAAVSNVAVSTSHMWGSIAAGESVKMTIKTTEIAIRKLEVNVKNEVTSAKITVNKLKDKPSSTPKPSDKVYEYLEIKPDRIKDADISSATITFEVTRAWLSDNGVSEDAIVLYRYVNDAWVGLDTKKAGVDSLRVKYEVVTPGFSYYAIGTKEIVSKEAPKEEEREEVEPTEPTPAVPEEKVKIPIKPAGKAGAIIAILLIIIIIAAVAYYYKAKKKKK